MNPESEVVSKAADKAIKNPELEQKILDPGTDKERILVSDPKLAAATVGYFSWSRASLAKLADAEKTLLSRCKAYITSKFVRLWNSSIYTVTAKANSESPLSAIPFVLIHGFAAGVAIWAANMDSLASKRTVHAFDILGFGRSSRPSFSTDPTLAELEFVQSIEDWRKEMEIDKMILVGHSFGPSLIKSLRSDLGARYALENPEAIYEYIYQCNVQNPTGEVAFSTMTKSFGWAKRPMINRFNGIDPKLPVTFVCGSKSWIDSGPAYEIQARRPNSYVDVQLLTGAGHHVYADVSETFNHLCSQISDMVDTDEDFRPINDTDNINNNKLEDSTCKH